MKSETFRCPHCARVLQKSAAVFVMGEAGEAAQPANLPPAVTCPGCGRDIPTAAMIRGDFDPKPPAAGCLGFLCWAAAAALLLVAWEPGFWIAVGIGAVATIALLSAADGILPRRPVLARALLLGALLWPILGIRLWQHGAERKAAERIESLGGRVRWRFDQVVIYATLDKPGIGDGDLACLEALPHLRRLDLDGAQVTDEGLRRLKGLRRLETLSLLRTRVTDKGLETLKALPRLETLSLGGTAVTEAAVRSLQRDRPGLEVSR